MDETQTTHSYVSTPHCHTYFQHLIPVKPVISLDKHYPTVDQNQQLAYHQA